MVKNERGFVLLLTFAFMTVLIALVVGLALIVMHETRDTGSQVEDAQMIYLAEAGVERAFREIRDDYTTTTQTGVAEVRGADTTGSVSVDNVGQIRYEEDANATLNDNADEARLFDFERNYTSTYITKVELGVRASRGGGGTGATIEVSYTTSGSFPEAGNTVLTQALTPQLKDYYEDITADRAWTWATVMSANFILRARRTAGDRDINLDYLFLRVTYEIDTNTEPWSTGSYQSYPLTLGSGTVQSVSLTAEQGKVHLNTASQALLRYLMVENGTADGTADSVASNIVSYRTSNNFDTIEEIQQVSGMTGAIYSAIDQDVTVYGYINTYAAGPAGARAPVNVNTASRAVLEAVFGPLTFTNTADIPALADAVITQRNAAPFTCFYSSDGSVVTDFFDFVRAQSYLNNAEDDRVLGNADASTLVPREGGNDEAGLSTEFAYDTNAFKIDSLARVNERDFRIRAILGDQGAQTFTTHVGDSTATGNHRENYE